MNLDKKLLDGLAAQLDEGTRERLNAAVDRIVGAKERGGKVVVVTGSGPNVHEGVTTLISELMRAGIVDGVTTSSAVVSHEMGGVLDKVKRADGRTLGVDPRLLPMGNAFELTLIDDDTLAEIAEDLPLDFELMERLRSAPGDTIVKAAGNLGYPMGLYLEHLSEQILQMAKGCEASFEEIAGGGADERTMIGRGARMGLPVLVTIPQLIGGGAVGLAIGDSLTIRERAKRIARMMESAEVIVESAVALTQEIHDGPFELHTGHGLWAAWEGEHTYSLEGKSLIRMDLDPALELAWQAQRQGSAVQEAIDKGLPKTKLFKIPFRMEMSGFARLEGSLAVTGDIGVLWPLLAARVSERLGVSLEFMSYPQQTPAGQAMREWIVENIKPVVRRRVVEAQSRGLVL